MRYFIDTEFIESGPGSPIWLLSIGIVAEDGRELYYVNTDAPLADANEFVKTNVLPFLPLFRPGYPKEFAPLEVIRDRVRLFCQGWDSIVLTIAPGAGMNPPDATRPEFWGYYADYDWVVFCQMFGRMVDLPKGWPMYCRDIKQMADDLGNPLLPKAKPGVIEHNALHDARWNRDAWQFLRDQWMNKR